MILGNYTQLNANSGSNIGGFTNPYDWMKLSNVMSFYYGDSYVSEITDKSSFNNGYLPPYSWVVAPKAGGMAMNIVGSSTFTTNLIPQYLALLDMIGSGDLAADVQVFGNIVCDLTGSSSWSADITADGNIEINFVGNGDITATITGDGHISIDMTGSGTLSAGASLFLNMICAMTGSGILAADASLVVSMLCDMLGGGTLTASITGQKEMVASMTGTGDLSADVNAFAEMIIGLIGSGVLNAGIGAIADMSIDMTVTGTGLSTDNVGKFVWEAILSDFSSNPDSAAAKLLAAGSAGDPWSTTLPAGYTGTQAGNILAQIQTLVDELHKIEGLSEGNPMVVTQSNRTAGTINLDITGDGETQTIVTRND